MRPFDLNSRPEEIRPRQPRAHNTWFRPGECPRLISRATAPRPSTPAAACGCRARRRAEADVALITEIRAAHEASHSTYGAPRVHAELAAKGIRIGRKLVARLMSRAALAGVSRRKFVVTTVKGVRRQTWSSAISRRRHLICCGWPTYEAFGVKFMPPLVRSLPISECKLLRWLELCLVLLSTR
jgi:HTH-like domain